MISQVLDHFRKAVFYNIEGIITSFWKIRKWSYSLNEYFVGDFYEQNIVLSPV